jgi:hypothetical protein
MGDDPSCVSHLGHGALPVSCRLFPGSLYPIPTTMLIGGILGTYSSCTAKEYEA